MELEVTLAAIMACRTKKLLRPHVSLFIVVAQQVNVACSILLANMWPNSNITMKVLVKVAIAIKQLANTSLSMLTPDIQQLDKIMAVLIKTSLETHYLFVKRQLVAAERTDGILF